MINPTVYSYASNDLIRLVTTVYLPVSKTTSFTELVHELEIWHEGLQQPASALLMDAVEHYRDVCGLERDQRGLLERARFFLGCSPFTPAAAAHAIECTTAAQSFYWPMHPLYVRLQCALKVLRDTLCTRVLMLLSRTDLTMLAERASFAKGLNDAFRTHKIDDEDMSRLMQSYCKCVPETVPGHCFSAVSALENIRRRGARKARVRIRRHE